MYQQYFGGVSIMKKEHYNKSNGYSNLFFGKETFLFLN
jgi:hypothetical protein